MAKKILLSISLLASDRPDSIRKCLDSLKPVMEQIPSELILVDTSKNELVHNILLEYTTKVYTFEWCNDFAKARNAGLKKAKGEWFLFLDDDEWFVETDPLVQFFQSGEYKKYTCANYLVRNFFDPEYVNYSDSWVSRMVRLTPDTVFKSKIHEYMYPAGQACKALPALAYHSGYIYATKEDERKHFERNTRLLKEVIKEEPDNLRWKVQLAQEYRAIKDWRNLHDFCRECIKKTGNLNSRYDNYDIGTFYVGAMESLLFLKNYDEAIRVGEESMQDSRMSLLCHVYIEMSFAVVYLCRKQYDKAEEYAHRYLHDAKKIKENKSELEAQKSALLVCEALDPISVKRVYSVLISCGLARKDTSYLKKYLKLLEWDQKVIYVMDGMADTMIEAIATIPTEPVLEEATQYMWNNRDLRNAILTKIQNTDSESEEYKRLLHVIAGLDGTHWYLYYARIRVADWDGKAEQMPQLVMEYYQHSTNVFLTPDEIIHIAEKAGVDIEKCYLSIDFNQWKEQIWDFLGKVTLNDILLIEKEFKERKTVEHPYYDELFVCTAEAKAKCILLEKKMDIKRKWMRQFADTVKEVAARYYQKDVVTQYGELLPANLQAGIWIAKGMETEETDFRKTLEAFKEAVEIYPGLAEAVKDYINALNTERQEKEKKQKEEMQKLEESIKSEVKKALDEKRAKDAYAILSELKKMRPDDLETAELALKARLMMISESVS